MSSMVCDGFAVLVMAMKQMSHVNIADQRCGKRLTEGY